MKYTPKYKIKSVKFTHKGNEFNVDGSKVITGIYEYEKGGRLADYTYIPKNNVKEFITDNGVVKSHSNGVWVLSGELVKTVKKPAPKRVAKTTSIKRGVMMPPSEKYKGVKNMPLDVFKLAENIVAMKKAKAKAKDIRSMVDLLSYEFKQNKDFNSWHEPLAYTALWFNSSIPLSFSIQILGNEDYYGEGIAKAFREQFVEAPDVSVSVKKINTGNFISNKAEQDLVKSFASKDNLRPQLNEIYLDDGYAVATNAHILLAIYDKSLLKKDEYFNATKVNTLSPYPKWRGVIPINSLKTQKINAKELLDFTNKVIKYGATNPTTKGIILKLGDNNYGFNISLLTQCLKAIMQLSKDDIYVHFTDGSTNRAVILTHIENWGLNKPDSTFALIMPIMVTNTFKDYIRYDANDNKVFAKGGEVDSDEIIETIWESNNTGRFIETKDGLKTKDSFTSFVKKNNPNYTADAIFDSNVYNGVIAVGSSKMDREEFRDYVAKAKQKKSRRWFKKGGGVKKKSNDGRGSIMQIAKEIRKDGEAWKDALKRAGAMLRDK